MSLKGARLELEHDISWFMNETATRGGVAVISTAGSGASMDIAANLCTYAAQSSGKKALGVLMNDVVDIDLTRQHLNWHKNEVQKGNKVTLLNKGWVTTNSIEGSVTAGAAAYLSSSGNIKTTLDTAGGLVATPLVGRFTSGKDEDGYAKFEVNLP